MGDEYRHLKHGEIIQPGDEVDACRDAWRDDPVWKPAGNIGEPAPAPQYPAHRIYRRKIAEADTICPRCSAPTPYGELCDMCLGG